MQVNKHFDFRILSVKVQRYKCKKGLVCADLQIQAHRGLFKTKFFKRLLENFSISNTAFNCISLKYEEPFQHFILLSGIRRCVHRMPFTEEMRQPVFSLLRLQLVEKGRKKETK